MGEIIKIKKAPIIKEELDNDCYPYYVMDFINRMKDKCDLSIFYKNIRDADFKPVDKDDMIVHNAAAEYMVFSNTVHYDPKSIEDGIMHELLHMASTIELPDRAMSGFMQVLNNGFGIGFGLNDGYTAYLDDRYHIDY